MDELRAFLHDCNVSGVVNVEYAIKAQTPQSGNQLALNIGADGHTELLTELYADGGSGSDDNVLRGIGNSRPNLLGIVPFGERACGADSDTLTAVDAGGFIEVHLESGSNVGLESTLVGADDGAMLIMLTYGDAAAAQYALGVIPYKVDGGIVDVGLHGLAELELMVLAAILLSKCLKLAVGAS